jgi:hypothetical protein
MLYDLEYDEKMAVKWQLNKLDGGDHGLYLKEHRNFATKA